jgi:sortase A
MDRHKKRFIVFERSLLAAGTICLIVFAAALTHRQVSSRLALEEFDRARDAQARTVIPVLSLEGEEGIDFGLWSEKRVHAYRESLRLRKGTPMAVLTIAKVHLRAPVFEGTDEWALNRGLGWISGTAKPGEVGNIGIAGHRDGFFRGLKDISIGDVIELATLQGAAAYVIDEAEIVSPNDVSVLRPRAKPSITLVTCYPFYFVGDAPKRFILHAGLKGQTFAGQSETASLPHEAH